MIFEKQIFLGVDGGQSHTEAVISDEKGNFLGRGFGGALDHGNLSEGRERLKNAINDSVNQALKNAEFPKIENVKFASAHFGLTGGAEYKEEIVKEIINAEKLVVGHDALTALFGATGGKKGIVVIAGTGSMIFGINENGKTARAGGLGFMFSDEGSGFWLAAETIKLAIKEQDRVIAGEGLEKLVTNFFDVREIRELTNDFYNGKIGRDRIAKFAERIFVEAENGNEILENLINRGAECLVENVVGAAQQLEFENRFSVSAVGGMFRGKLMKQFFIENLQAKVQNAEFTEPMFPPPIGALLLAFQNSDIEIKDSLLDNLRKSYTNLGLKNNL